MTTSRVQFELQFRRTAQMVNTGLLLLTLPPSADGQGHQSAPSRAGALESGSGLNPCCHFWPVWPRSTYSPLQATSLSSIKRCLKGLFYELQQIKTWVVWCSGRIQTFFPNVLSTVLWVYLKYRVKSLITCPCLEDTGPRLSGPTRPSRDSSPGLTY